MAMGKRGAQHLENGEGLTAAVGKGGNSGCGKRGIRERRRPCLWENEVATSMVLREGGEDCIKGWGQAAFGEGRREEVGGCRRKKGKLVGEEGADNAAVLEKGRKIVGAMGGGIMGWGEN
uniref:Uncharacterized protein n=1 Tax=Cucumis melo TaxID=3656 RepID=A0A9I9D0Z6_CUCME